MGTAIVKEEEADTRIISRVVRNMEEMNVENIKGERPQTRPN